MPVVQHPVLASAVCRRWLWMLGLCGSTSPEINFHQSLEYFYLFSLQSSSNSVLKMELISYSNWIFFSGFLFRGAPLPFFQKLSLQSLISSLTFSSSVLTRACISLGESLSFPPTATVLHLDLVSQNKFQGFFRGSMQIFLGIWVFFILSFTFSFHAHDNLTELTNVCMFGVVQICNWVLPRF